MLSLGYMDFCQDCHQHDLKKMPCYVSNDTERHLFILLSIMIFFLAPIPN